MERPLDLVPSQPARIAPFLGRRRQQDALYRTIPGAATSGAATSGATGRREAAAAGAAKTADGGAQILAYPEAGRMPDTR
jgi:hypothetical protein